ncbi:MAG: phosphate acyltransferase PlsX, partial [Deltaproteobacteria bacterium]
MVRVAVDAMGGDHAPDVVITGVLEAVKRFDVAVLLVGREEEIRRRLAEHSYDPQRVTVVHASEAIQMDESPAAAIRRKKDSSICVGIQCVKEGRADAFFSAGNTGAVVCGATLRLGLLETIERPGIAIVMPNRTGVSLIIDAGANIDPKPIHLLQYAIMGSAYFESILGKTRPRVGLLNVGEEEAKGTDFVRETYQLIEQSPVNFIGNVEGKHIFSGQCDVIVTDGFVGNVTLKVAEGIAETLSYFLKHELSASWAGRVAYLLGR